MKKLFLLLTFSLTAIAFENDVDIMCDLVAGKLTAELLLDLIIAPRVIYQDKIIKKKTSKNPSLCWYITPDSVYMPNPKLEGYLTKFVKSQKGKLLPTAGVWRVDIKETPGAKPNQPAREALFSKVKK